MPNDGLPLGMKTSGNSQELYHITIIWETKKQSVRDFPIFMELTNKKTVALNKKMTNFMLAKNRNG